MENKAATNQSEDRKTADGRPASRYQPIENYGLVGDLHTVALVGLNGSIDWLCLPNFDSPSVFASMLDADKGGHFSIRPVAQDIREKQFYWPETNVLVTRFFSSEGVAEIIDFMPVGGTEPSTTGHHLIRKLAVVRGHMRFRLECTPSFDYARATHTTTLQDDGAIFTSANLRLGLATAVALREYQQATPGGSGVSAEFELGECAEETFVLQSLSSEDTSCGVVLDTERSDELFEATVQYWRNWLSKCTYTGRWREMVQRSALTLKLLTYAPTGAIVAAPTTSLPEGIGGERNWDYRYTWIRDAAFTVYGLMRIGFTEEAERFMGWVEARCHELNPDGSLQIMYGIDGRHELTEETLDHLEGYAGSKPVRIGNGAWDQLQLDIYGELLDSVYIFNKHGIPISYDFWQQLRKLVNWIADNWERTDEGVWEVRGGQRHFTYSKLMAWVALDRGLRLAEKRSFPADRERWIAVRDQIFERIMAEGWSEERGAFVQSFGSQTLDASNLMMPLVFFVSPGDPRMLSTLDETLKTPKEGGLVANGLTFRYNVEESPDGLSGEEGTFNICSFWLVEALTRAGQHDHRRLEEARLMFEKMFGFANHLGLYAEETGPTGEHLGNFPQAFTHLSLISAAYNLDRALGAKNR